LKALDVVVVGAGMFGSAAGKYLGRAGANVLIIGPQEPEAGTVADQRSFGAHFDEARISRRLGWDPVWGMTDSRSLERFRDIEAESGRRFFHECGSLVLMAKSISARSDSIMRQCIEKGITVDRMSEDALQKHFKHLRLPSLPGGVEGLYEKREAGYLNPRKLVKAQLGLAEKAGATLLRAALMNIAKDDLQDLWRLDVSCNGERTEIAAKRVLVATGAFTNHNGVLPHGYQLAMRAFTEPNLLFELSEKDVDRLHSMPCVITVDPTDTGDENLSSYLLPPVKYPDGKWYARIGPGMQPIVRMLDDVQAMNAWYAAQKITPAQSIFLKKVWDVLLADFTPVSIRHACCIVEKTPTCYPYIGHVGDEKNFAVAVGGNGHGARGSDEIGRLAANVVLGRAWDAPIDQSIFTPIPAGDGSAWKKRPGFLKPPFGLC